MTRLVSTGKKRSRATIVDVAAHAGVSTASVSKVLRNAYGVSDAMRQRVEVSMLALAYRPDRLARGMRGRTYTIGMMVSDIENPFFSLLSTGMTGVFAHDNYELLIAPGGDSASRQQAITDALIDHQMDGIVLVAPSASDEGLEAIAQQVPVVVVGRNSASRTLDSVSGDDEMGARLVVDHLVGLGHERIAFVMHNGSDDPSMPQSRRLRGFEAAMAAHGLVGDIVYERWSLEGGRRAARAVTELPSRPTAVHAGADVAAFGMLSEMWEHGLRVPDEFSLAGYDNSPTSAIGPISLTTVDQAGLVMGSLAAELLLERIAGRIEPRHELLQPRLVVRSTTGPAKSR